MLFVCLIIIFQNHTCCIEQSSICLETGADRLSLLSFGFLLLGAGLHLEFVVGMLCQGSAAFRFPLRCLCVVWGVVPGAVSAL